MGPFFVFGSSVRTLPEISGGVAGSRSFRMGVPFEAIHLLRFFFEKMFQNAPETL
jgi:hypothetical protein